VTHDRLALLRGLICEGASVLRNRRTWKDRPILVLQSAW